RDAYSTDENSQFVFITTQRDDGHLGAATANFDAHNLEQGPGAATAFEDFDPFAQIALWPSTYDRSRQVSEAERGPNNEEYFVSYQQPGTVLFSIDSIYVPILDDTFAEGDEDLELSLIANPTTILLGGEPIPTWPAIGRETARLTIIDNDFQPGVIGFSDAQYIVAEDGKTATITLTRTNGAAGVVSVDYRTLTGGSATPWNPITRQGDYDPISIATVSFGAGQTNASFTVSIRDDSTAEVDETVKLQLLNPTGGATLGRTAATLVIVDNDFGAGRINFATNALAVDEGNGTVTITVQRVGGSVGSSQVTLSTSDLTAKSGIDYRGTNVVLKWASGDITARTITIPILDQNTVDSNRVFKVTLSNPIVNNVAEPNALGNVSELLVSINDNDAFGNLRFSQPAYVVDENGTNAIITVVRVNGLVGDMRVDYSATPQLAIPGQDFQPVSGTLFFTNNQTAATFVVPILDDTAVDGNKSVLLNLSNQTNNLLVAPQPGTLASPSKDVVLTIIDNELENIPAGTLDATFLAEGADAFIYTVALQKDDRLLVGGDFNTVNSVLRKRLARLYSDGTLDSTFFAGEGPNGSVRAMQVQEDSRIVIAGSFTAVSGKNRNYIARLVQGGDVDPTFDPGAGANNPIYAMILQADGKIVIGGNFSAYGPTPRNGIARINQSGTLDFSFDPGTGAAASGSFTVYAIAQQLDGKLIVGGDFELFNSVPAKRIVRLNRDGSVDTNFNTSVGANGSVRSLAVQPDGRILVGGIFSSIQGVAANNIARLNPDGSVDTSFNAATDVVAAKRGANGPVLSIAVQIDGKIVLGGDFGEYNGVTRRGITRLNSDGGNDPTINFGTGANGSVAALAVQPDRKIVLAGGFTEYDGQPRLRLARINGGSTAGSGRFEFTKASFIASEAGTNVIITVRRVGGTAGTVRMNYTTQADPAVTGDSVATPGADFTPVSGTLTFAEGETQASFKVPISNDTLVENEEIFDVALSDLPGEPTRLGDLPTARVVIVSDDSEIFFSAPAYSVSESIPSGTASITVSRAGSVAVQASVDLRTSDGTATAGADYVALTNTVTFAVGESQRTIPITILPDLLVEGNEYLNLTLSNPSPGALLRVGGDTARLTIVDDDSAPGEIRFQRPNYSVREGTLLAQVAVIRTNGTSGTVTVQFSTQAISATPDQDYSDVSGVLTF
ncbi:MAG TPA: Calx-beta domain-containing protein, partial [Verrucomicrobiae bacterium]